MARRNLRILFFAPVPAILLAIALDGADRGVGRRLYDVLLRLRPPAAVSREILQVDIEGGPVVESRSFDRSELAEGLILMKELEAGAMVLDFSFSVRSPPSADPVLLREALSADIEQEYRGVAENIRSLFDGIRLGSVRPVESARYVQALIDLVEHSKLHLLEQLGRMERDEDVYLAQALRFCERCYLPLEILPGRAPAPEYAGQLTLLERVALPRVSGALASYPGARDLAMPVTIVAEAARGAGYREAVADPDGVIRRVRLIARIHGRALGQVAFVALLDRLGQPSVKVARDRLTVDQRGSPSPSRLVIPLDVQGCAFIDWPRVGMGPSFRRLSWGMLQRCVAQERELEDLLRELDRIGCLSYYHGDEPMLQIWDGARRVRDDILQGGDTREIPAWREAREHLLQTLAEFLRDPAEKRIVADAQKALEVPGITAADGERYRVLGEKTPELFARSRKALTGLQATRAELRRALQNALCVVSLSGVSGQVAGRTPFGQEVSWSDAAAAAANTILAGRMVRELPDEWRVAATALLSLLAPLALFRLRPSAYAVAGALAAPVVGGGSAALFLLATVWVDPLIPGLCLALSFWTAGIVKAGVPGRAGRAQETPPGRDL